MAFLRSVQIDFIRIEYELEQQGKQIDWNTADEGTQDWIYGVMNEDIVIEIEEGKHANQYELVQWIMDKLLHYCEENDVRILELDASGNVIEDEEFEIEDAQSQH